MFGNIAQFIHLTLGRHRRFVIHHHHMHLRRNTLRKDGAQRDAKQARFSLKVGNDNGDLCRTHCEQFNSKMFGAARAGTA